MVQWLRCCASSAGGLGLIPGQGTRSHRLQLKISHGAMKIEGPLCLKEEPAQPNYFIKKKKKRGEAPWQSPWVEASAHLGNCLELMWQAPTRLGGEVASSEASG